MRTLNNFHHLVNNNKPPSPAHKHTLTYISYTGLKCFKNRSRHPFKVLSFIQQVILAQGPRCSGRVQRMVGALGCALECS